MKKFIISAAIAGAAIVLLIIVARLSGMVQFYHGATGSMSPTIEPGDEFFATNMVKPKHNDIIIFKRKMDEFDGVESPGTMATFTYRLIAMGGEKIEIRNGLAYVNDKLADDSTKLKFIYEFDGSKTKTILEALHLSETIFDNGEWMMNGGTKTNASLNYQQFIIANKITPIKKFQDTPGMNLYQNVIAKNWTPSNYGPIIIPVGHYFLLGDNRDGARDSRYIGPINNKDVTGVVIGVK
jgi:signal peptidase I